MGNRVIIIGAGFAGLAAARGLAGLARADDGVSVTLLDACPHTTMAPSLPDLAAGRYAARYATGRIERLIGRGIEFRNERATAVDLDRKTVVTRETEYGYDFLVLAAGSVTNLFGFDQHLEAVHTLDSAADADRIRDDFHEYMQRSDAPLALVVGGGYTGLELACNLRFAGRNFGSRPRVLVAELQDTVLPFMPEWVREYMLRQLQRRGIEALTGVTVREFDGQNVTLSDGTLLKDVFLCWTAGTKFAIEDIRGQCERIKDGRFEVDDYLRVKQYNEVFAAGDAAAVRHEGAVLRKAVNFARDSGRIAGLNIRHAVEGRPMELFKPVDLGWVIPFCDVGVGKVFGRVRVRGRLPLALHYGMCGLRNYTLTNLLFYWRRAFASLSPLRRRIKPGSVH